MTNLTEAQRRVLLAVAEGKLKIKHHGAHAFYIDGGENVATQTVQALKRRGLLIGFSQLTDAGKQTIKLLTLD